MVGIIAANRDTRLRNTVRYYMDSEGNASGVGAKVASGVIGRREFRRDTIATFHWAVQKGGFNQKKGGTADKEFKNAFSDTELKIRLHILSKRQTAEWAEAYGKLVEDSEKQQFGNALMLINSINWTSYGIEREDALREEMISMVLTSDKGKTIPRATVESAVDLTLNKPTKDIEGAGVGGARERIFDATAGDLFDQYITGNRTVFEEDGITPVVDPDTVSPVEGKYGYVKIEKEDMFWGEVPSHRERMWRSFGGSVFSGKGLLATAGVTLGLGATWIAGKAAYTGANVVEDVKNLVTGVAQFAYAVPYLAIPAAIAWGVGYYLYKNSVGKLPHDFGVLPKATQGEDSERTRRKSGRSEGGGREETAREETCGTERVGERVYAATDLDIDSLTVADFKKMFPEMFERVNGTIEAEDITDENIRVFVRSTVDKYKNKIRAGENTTDVKYDGESISEIDGDYHDFANRRAAREIDEGRRGVSTETGLITAGPVVDRTDEVKPRIAGLLTDQTTKGEDFVLVGGVIDKTEKVKPRIAGLLTETAGPDGHGPTYVTEEPIVYPTGAHDVWSDAYLEWGVGEIEPVKFDQFEIDWSSATLDEKDSAWVEAYQKWRRGEVDIELSHNLKHAEKRMEELLRVCEDLELTPNTVKGASPVEMDSVTFEGLMRLRKNLEVYANAKFDSDYWILGNLQEKLRVGINNMDSNAVRYLESRVRKTGVEISALGKIGEQEFVALGNLRDNLRKTSDYISDNYSGDSRTDGVKREIESAVGVVEGKRTDYIKDRVTEATVALSTYDKLMETMPKVNDVSTAEQAIALVSKLEGVGKHGEFLGNLSNQEKTSGGVSEEMVAKIGEAAKFAGSHTVEIPEAMLVLKAADDLEALEPKYDNMNYNTCVEIADAVGELKEREEALEQVAPGTNLEKYGVLLYASARTAAANVYVNNYLKANRDETVKETVAGVNELIKTMPDMSNIDEVRNAVDRIRGTLGVLDEHDELLDMMADPTVLPGVDKGKLIDAYMAVYEARRDAGEYMADVYENYRKASAEKALVKSMRIDVDPNLLVAMNLVISGEVQPLNVEAPKLLGVMPAPDVPGGVTNLASVPTEVPAMEEKAPERKSQYPETEQVMEIVGKLEEIAPRYDNMGDRMFKGMRKLLGELDTRTAKLEEAVPGADLEKYGALLHAGIAKVIATVYMSHYTEKQIKGAVAKVDRIETDVANADKLSAGGTLRTVEKHLGVLGVQDERIDWLMNNARSVTTGTAIDMHMAVYDAQVKASEYKASLTERMNN